MARAALWAIAIVLATSSCGAGATPASPEAPPSGRPAPSEAIEAPRPPPPWLEPLAASDALREAFAAEGLPADTELGEPATILRFLGVVAPHLEPLHRDCEAKSRLACWLWDDVVERAVEATRKAGDPARELLGRHCEGGTSIACAVAAESFDHPSGVGGNPVRAVAEMMPVCQAGFTGVCARAALIRYGSGIEMAALSEAEAIAAFDRACDAGFLEGCHMVAYQTGAYDPASVLGSRHHLTRARVCELGQLSSCTALLDMLIPPAPFGCDRCDPASMAVNEWLDVDGNFEERCIDCYVVACRAEHCCAGCPGKHACCGDEPAVEYPVTAKPLSPEQAARVLEALREPFASARALWAAGCERGHPRMCLDDELQAELDELRERLEQLTRRR